VDDPAREVVAGLFGPNDGPLVEPVELDLAGAGCGLTGGRTTGTPPWPASVTAAP